MARPDSKLTGGQIVIFADPCKDNTLAEMEAHLTNFFDKITKVGGAVSNLSSDINKTVRLLSNASIKFINKIVGAVSDGITKAISEGLDAWTGSLLSDGLSLTSIFGIQSPLVGLTKTLLDAIDCLITKIVKATKDIFKDLLTGAVKNVLNAGFCVVEQMMGAFTNKLTNLIDSAITPLLGPIKGLMDTFFKFNVKDFILGGINMLRKIENFFKCDKENICPASSKYKIDQGAVKDGSKGKNKDFFDKVFSGSAISQGAGNLINDFEKEYGKWEIFGSPVGDSAGIGPCEFGNITKCGAPTVDFFGGDGFGGAGKVILGKFVDKLDTEDIVGSVQKTASIVGVEITDPGQGYADAPFISFGDGCNMGYGAYGRAVIDQNPSSPTFGKITSVVIVSEGENYPADIDEDPLYISDIVVQDGGEDYDENDTVEGVDLEIVDGRVVSARVQSGYAYNGLPKLNINSSTGFGAVLKPIMSVATPQTEIVQIIDCVS
jgi:hypothetical protein